MAKKPEAKMTDRVADQMKKAGKAIKDSTSKAAENASSLNVKVLDHAEANTREAFAAMRAAAKASKVTDVVKIQSDYIREQGARSMQQAREIGELIAQFGRDAVSQIRGK